MTITIPIWLIILLSTLLIPAVIVLSSLVVIGVLDVYAMLRFRKNNGIDRTAIMGNWISLKWMLASRTDELLEKLPWLGQDLSEVLGVKEDDGQVT